MSTTKAPPRTATEINARMSEIGAELAKGRLAPVPNARALEAELDRLRGAYVDALNREGEAKAEAEAVRMRVEAAQRSAREAESEKRITQAVDEALGR